MPIRPISEIGSTVIRTPSKEVASATSPQVRKLVANLTETMRHENLVGIAAPQIGVGLRVFVTEVRKTVIRKYVSKPQPLCVFINPVIVHTSKKTVSDYEGCGSVASGKLFGTVKRPESITVRAHNEKGEQFEVTASGLFARIIQHEIDHLNGICFIDKVTDTKKLLGREEYKKLAKRERAKK